MEPPRFRLPRIADEYGLLTAVEAGRVLGADDRDDRAAADLADQLHREGKVLAVSRAGSKVFPGFQFRSGTVLDFVEPLIAGARNLDVDQDELIRWLVQPTTYWNVDGTVPLAHANDPRQLVEALRFTVGGDC